MGDNDFLDSGLVGGGQFSGGVFGWSELFLDTIVWSSPGMGRVLWWCSRSWMSEAKECSLDISGHRDVDYVVVIGSYECEPTVFGACPIDFEDVFLGKDADQVINIGLVGVLDAKVINHEGEFGGMSLCCARDQV